jgi:two-component system response regulator NreC
MVDHLTIRVLCVDDHAFVVDGLRTRIEVEPDMEFAGHAPTAEGLPELVEETGATIVLLDIDMPGPDVFEAIRGLRRQRPDARAILLSAFVRDRYIDAAYEAGAWGYLSKSDAPDDVIAGIRRVAQGELAYSDAVTDRSLPDTAAAGAVTSSKLSLLTTREQQILRMIAKGMSRSTIAEDLCRSPMTVDNHRKSIMKKLGIHDRVELVRYAIAEGLVEV